MSVKLESLGIGMEAALKGLRQRGYRPDVVFDIGAADGSWTRLAMRYWPETNFVCFEPLSERLHDLNALRSAHTNHVSVQECGVGDSDGELSMGVTESLWDSSFAYSGSTSRRVPIHRLDSLIERGQIPVPSFIKIDVQGFEKRVLDGGRQAVRSTDMVLMECTFFKFCEDMRTLDETIAYMSQFGFIPYEFVDYLRRPLDGAMGQCDILFVKKDHWLVSDHRWG